MKELKLFLMGRMPEAIPEKYDLLCLHHDK